MFPVCDLALFALFVYLLMFRPHWLFVVLLRLSLAAASWGRLAAALHAGFCCGGSPCCEHRLSG